MSMFKSWNQVSATSCIIANERYASNIYKLIRGSFFKR